MDNLPIPPEQNLEQPVVPPPPKINPMFIIGGLILIAIILTGGIFIGRYLNTSQNIPAQEITPIPSVTPRVIPSVTPSETPSPTPTITTIPDPTANWKTYSDPNYKFSIDYPSGWKIQGNGDYQRGEYFVKIYPNYKTEVGYEDTALYLGSAEVFSTSGAICANASCKQHDVLQVTIAGNMYSSPILGEYMNGTNRIIRSRFQFEINNIAANGLTITANYHTKEDKNVFGQILSTFKFTNPLENKDSSIKCVTGGCNGETCKDENAEQILTACVWFPQYACYKTAKCEVQNDGKCGWTLTAELNSCLSKYQTSK